MAPKQVDPAARREDILAAAVRVFARKGFAATRIEDVAVEAGIGKGSVYLAFGSRDELLDAAFEAMHTASEATIRAARAGDDPPLERLADLVCSVLTAASADPQLARVALDLWTVGRGEVDAPLDMAAIYAAYRTAITGLLEEAADDGSVRAGVGAVEATVIVGAIEGCLLQWVMDPSLPIGELADPIVTVCLDGIRRTEVAS